MSFRLPPLLAALLLAASAAATPARAAESYDNCTGMITTLPAVITTQGIWCMNQDLTTAMTSGAAITVNAHNVTIDCNHFKLGGLSAGLATGTWGIKSIAKANTTVRHCNVRGFLIGIAATLDDGGHVIEDNRLDSNTALGILAGGDGALVRRNQVLHTGGNTLFWTPRGIGAEGGVQILDNQVEGVTRAEEGGDVFGIHLGLSAGGRIDGNSVRGVYHPSGYELNIYAYNSSVVIGGNEVFGSGLVNSYGIYCNSSTNITRDNSMLDLNFPLSGCQDVTGNYAY